MAGEGLNGVRAELLHPFAQHVLMDVQVSRSLCRRHPALPNQPDRLDLELSTKLSSPHDYSGSMKHLNLVSIKPAATQIDKADITYERLACTLAVRQEPD